MFKNWKTSLAGALIGGAYTVLSALQQGGITLKDALIAGGIAAVGLLARDIKKEACKAVAK